MFSLLNLNDEQVGILTGVGGWLTGLLTSLLVEWYKKRKNPKEVDANVANQLIIAANDTSETTQKLVNLLEERLARERTYYDDVIGRSKRDCEFSISEMKKSYDIIIDDLQAQIIKGEHEKNELRKQIYTLTGHNETLQAEVVDLRNRLEKYDKRDDNADLSDVVE